jgi:hypothetical protein
MNPRDLVMLVLSGKGVEARQWVQDAVALDWSSVDRPHDLDDTQLAVLAGLVEMFAERAASKPPSWTADVSAAPSPVYLVQAAMKASRLRRQCEEQGPVPLRTRRVYAPSGYLTHT